MRSVVFALSALTLTGCATVSVVPGTASVNGNLSENQSSLRATSDAFCAQVREAGWVEETDGILGFARMLMRGVQDEGASQNTYAKRIGAETDSTDLVFSRIAEDAEQARQGLSRMLFEAEAILRDDGHADRDDVMYFERSLISAQDAHRNFAQAADLTSKRSGYVPQGVDRALADLAREIDESRRVADDLADLQAELDDKTVS